MISRVSESKSQNSKSLQLSAYTARKNQNSMQRKMEVLQSIRAHLKNLGIESTRSTKFNGKLCLAFLSFVLSIILNVLFLLNSAKSVMDYILCFCIMTALLGIGLCFSAIAMQKVQLFKYIGIVEKLINQSK